MNMLGAYQKGTSVLHRLSPSALVASYLLFLISIILLSTRVIGIGISLLLVILLYRTGGIKLKGAFKSLWKFRVFIVTVFLLNACFQPSGSPLFTWWFVTISLDGAMIGLRMIATVVLVTLLSTLLTSVATPVAITDGLKSLLHPLSYLHLKTDEVAAVISLAITMIPVLARESRLILLSSLSRGAAVKDGKLREKALSFVPMVLPLFLAAFRKADELSLAMEARGYSGERNRTKRKSHYSKSDACAVMISILFSMSVITLKGVF